MRLMMPPIIGPKVNPSPKAAPIMPIHFERCIGRGDISDVSLRDGDVAAGDAGEDARREKQRERMRHAHDCESNRRARETDHEDRPAAEPIRKLPEQRGEDDLHPGVDAGQQTDLERAWRGSFSA